MFRTVPLSIIRSFSLYTRNCICHTGLMTACEQDQSRIRILIPDPDLNLSANLYDI